MIRVSRPQGNLRSSPAYQLAYKNKLLWPLSLSLHHQPRASRFTHETESPWTLHFKHSHWWKRRSRWSKFATSHYAWQTNRVSLWTQGGCKKSTWILTWHETDQVSWSLGLFSKITLGGRPNTKLRDQGNPNACTCWFILFYHVWGPTWIEICGDDI